jgi:hypothetical protein
MRCIRFLVFAGFVFTAFSLPARSQDNPAAAPQKAAQPTQRGSLLLPAGTNVSLALTRPLWMRSAKAGDDVYAMTAFPVSADNQIAIPAGTYVAGLIDELTKPGRFSSHAEVHIRFTKLVFANGYTILLDTAPPAISNLRVQVSYNSDILLDNGAPMEMLLGTALPLDAARAADASRVSKPPELTQFRTASRCVPTAGTPGSAPTVIPGTPGTSGTPPTVIPGGPGFPPTVIPGTPGTPGTPPTVIPGSSGTSGVACPAPPVVIQQAPSRATADHVKSFSISVPVYLAGTPLTSGTYRVAWRGPDPEAPVDVTRNGKLVVHTHAHIVTLDHRAESDNVDSSAGPNGTLVLKTVRFAGDTLQISFAE